MKRKKEQKLKKRRDRVKVKLQKKRERIREERRIEKELEKINETKKKMQDYQISQLKYRNDLDEKLNRERGRFDQNYERREDFDATASDKREDF